MNSNFHSKDMMHQILLVFGNTNGFVNPMLISFQQNVSCEDGSYHPLLK